MISYVSCFRGFASLNLRLYLYVCVPCRWVVSWNCIIRLRHAAVSTPTSAQSIAEKMWDLKKLCLVKRKEMVPDPLIHSLTDTLIKYFILLVHFRHHTKHSKCRMIQPLPSRSSQYYREIGLEQLLKCNQLIVSVKALWSTVETQQGNLKPAQESQHSFIHPKLKGSRERMFQTEGITCRDGKARRAWHVWGDKRGSVSCLWSWRWKMGINWKLGCKSSQGPAQEELGLSH